MSTSGQSRASRHLPQGIWVLGFVSMLMDVSSELVHSLLPVFLVSILGASVFTVGLIEGVAEAVALIVRVFSGTLSDRLGRRKALAVIGYALGALSKPLFAVGSSIAMIVAARFIDRIGKGIRGAPRDALIADLAPTQMRGAAYGLRQSLDTVGAFLGPLLAIGLMLLWSNDFRTVFWIAVIPGAIAPVLLFFGVHEADPTPRDKRINPLQWSELVRLRGAYWTAVGIGALFMLARFSEAFLVLRAGHAGLPLVWIPLVMVAMNVVYAISAYPFGRLSDRVRHTSLLAGGLVVLIGADLVLARAESLSAVFFGIALWGLHMGMTQGLLATMVAEQAPVALRGTAFGFFNLISGVALLLASATAGLLWDRFGPSITFQAGAFVCALALTAVALGRQDATPKKPPEADG